MVLLVCGYHKSLQQAFNRRLMSSVLKVSVEFGNGIVGIFEGKLGVVIRRHDSPRTLTDSGGALNIWNSCEIL